MLEIVKDRVAKFIADAAGVHYEEALNSIEISQKQFGDLTSKIAFMLAQTKKENPAKIANEIANELKNKKIDFIERVEANGPYINFYFSDEFYSEALKKILKEKENFGRCNKTGKNIMIEFFDANTHKGIHIGHIRNISLGESLSRILEFVGNNVIRTNYQGDIGPHVAKCIWGFLNLYNGKAPKKNRGVWLGKVYAEASKAIENNKELEQQADDINLKLYAKDKKITEIWKKTRKWCIDDFNRFYKEFNVKFDEFYFESETEAIGKNIAYDLLKRGIAQEDQGAVIVDLRNDGLGVVVLITKDGYPLYAAKDLGLAKLKFEKYKLDRSIHVVGKEQELYFKQLFKIFEKAGGIFENAAKVSHHLIYELVMLPEGKMSSREGTMVLYEDLKEKLMELVKEEVKKRHAEWNENEIERTAKKIVLAAIKFSMLRRESNKTLIFDWKEALNLEGDSGPYLQYAYVRTKGILRKARYKPNVAQAYKFNENERTLIKRLCGFPAVVVKCSKDLSPHPLVEYLLDAAAELNKFYTTSPVLNAERKEEKETRLAIVRATSNVLKTGLFLLGIEAVERM
jgi:arginyl-tRNA synthetase